MLRVATLALTIFPCMAWSHTCQLYEYSNLSVVQVLIKKDSSIESQKLYVSYNEENAIATWADNEAIAGSIKKPLKQYFGINHIDKINILNSLGKRGWSAFSHQHIVGSEYESTDNWYLKKCVNT